MTATRRQRRSVAVPALVRRTAWNGIGQFSPQAAQLVLTPVILHYLGVDRYGIWALVGVVMSFVSQMDGGLGSSLGWFFARYGTERDRDAAARLAATVSVAIVVVGVIITVAIGAVMPTIVSHTHIPTRLRAEAIGIRDYIGPLVATGLLANVGIAALQANGRFRASGLITAASVAANVVATIVLLDQGWGLRGLFVAGLASNSLLIAAGAVAARPHISIRLGLMHRDDRALLVRYGVRMQVTRLTYLANVELDALVIAAFLPVREVGYYAIGANVANGVRALPIYALSPTFTLLTTTYASSGLAATLREFVRLNRAWLTAIIGYGIVGTTTVGFGIVAWLGPRYERAGVVAAILFAGYAVNLVTGVSSTLARAIGKPGLETRYGVWCTVINLALTVPFAKMFGLYGVVSATAIGSITGSIYFARILRRSLPGEALGNLWVSPRVFPTVLALVICVGGELARSTTHIRGIVGLGSAGAIALLALVAYAAFVRDELAAGRRVVTA